MRMGIDTCLGQSGHATQTIESAMELLASPAGLLAAFLGLLLAAAVLLRRDGVFLGGACVLVLMTMMAQENRWFDNTLVAPLEQLRAGSRAATLALLVAMALNLLFTPPGFRRRRVTFAMLAFIAFESVYRLRLGMHGEVTRAALGWVAVVLVLAVFGVGFARRLETEDDFERYVRMFVAASAVFVALNLVQLGLGYRNAIAGGRFAGISGNPQLAGYVRAVFILFNTHVFSTGPLGSPARWLSGILIGLLAILLLWTGSRTGALCGVAGVLGYFRLRLGGLTLLAATGGASLAAAASFFSESLEGVDRFVGGENTRREV
jgi:hypothetical protein